MNRRKKGVRSFPKSRSHPQGHLANSRQLKPANFPVKNARGLGAPLPLGPLRLSLNKDSFPRFTLFSQD